MNIARGGWWNASEGAYPCRFHVSNHGSDINSNWSPYASPEDHTLLHSSGIFLTIHDVQRWVSEW